MPKTGGKDMENWRNKSTLSVPEAAKVLGVSRSLGFSMAKSGQLPVLRLGSRRLVVPTSALARMLDCAAGE
jgi:excisionase family DNA binding protein